MSRIPTQQSTHWLASSFRGICCRQSMVPRNRIRRIGPRTTALNTSPIQPRLHCFFSTSSTSSAAKKPKIDAATLDNISNTLIQDLYSNPSSKKTVTIDDILALKPAKKSVSVDEFNKIKDLVASSFNMSQLKGVLRAQKKPSGGKKSVLVNQIMLFMDLDVEAAKAAPAPVEEPYTPIEPTTQKYYQSSRRELFFMLEAEGDTLRRLEKEMNVRVAINIANETYMIQGSEKAIMDAQDQIRELVMVTEETWNISSYSDRDLVMSAPSVLEDIARRSGTFVSAGSDGNTLIIAGRSSKAMDDAKRLFDLKLHKTTDGIESQTYFHQEDELKPVGMFPVYDPVAMTVDESQNSYLRICQTEPYAEKILENPTIHPVRTAPGHINTLEELRKHTKDLVDGAIASNHTFDLSAHFGQVLFLNKNPNLAQLPISGAVDTLDLEEWFKNAEDIEAPYFWNSLPFFKAVANLPLVSPKTKTIEVEYVPSSRFLSASDSSDPALIPIRVVFTLNHEGDLIIQGAKAVNRQFLSNIMMFSQPTDVQLRSELSTTIEPGSPILSELTNHTTLLSTNRLQCPSFHTFRNLLPSSASAVPAAAQLGLGLVPTHTLRSVLFRTSGIFDYEGLPLVASDIIDQYGQVRRQEIKLLPLPLSSRTEVSSSSTTESDTDASESASASSASSSTSLTSPLENWDDFMKATLHFSRTL